VTLALPSLDDRYGTRRVPGKLARNIASDTPTTSFVGKVHPRVTRARPSVIDRDGCVAASLAMGAI